MSQYSKYPVIGGGSGSGTVTSVALAAPVSLFTVSGSPVSTSGTLALTLATKTANTVFAGPTTGSAAAPAFRALVAADIPSLGYIASINTDTTAAQLLVAATTGTDFTIATVAGTTTFALPSASATARGVITTGTQTIAGAKTFSGAISASNLSGTNTGDVTLGAVGSSPSANGASLSGQVLTLQPADATHPGVVTAGTQTIAGDKTFSGAISASNLSGTNTGDVTIGTANGLSLSSQALSLAAATTSVAGAMSAADKTKLDAIGMPGTRLYWTEDFDAGSINGTTNWAFASSGAGASMAGSDAGHPGSTSLSATTDTTGIVIMYKGQVYIFGAGTAKMDIVTQVPVLSTVSDTFTMRWGFGDNFGSSADQTNGAYFEYTDTLNGGQFVCKTANAGTRTSTNTSVAVTAGAWVHLQIIVNAAGTSVDFLIDGVLVATNATNVPTAAVACYFQLGRGAATGARVVYIDVVVMEMLFTTPRWT